MTMGNGPANNVQARADLYGLLSELFSFPSAGLAEAVTSGDLAGILETLAGALPYHLPLGEPGLRQEVEAAELEAEYIRLFDLPGGGKQCPLYTGVYARQRRDAMEELLRFYRFFGLTVGGGKRDLPDSLPTVLEFQRYLVLREASPSEAKHGARVAQRDVLVRHLLPWAAATRERLATRSPGPFYAGLVELAASLFAAELEAVDQAAVGAEQVDHPVRV